jgi:hypothetical protein
MACAAASVAALLVHRFLVFNGQDPLSGTYLGSPPLAHVTWLFLRRRLFHLIRDRSDIYVPVFVMLLVAWRLRNPLLALGPLACVPWALLALFAVSHQAGELWGYYAFPFMAALAWPALSLVVEPTAPRRTHMMVQALVVVLSIGLFATSRASWDPSPWYHLAPLPAGRIARTETVLDVLQAHRAALGNIIVDDAVGSLRPGAFSSSELRYGLIFTEAEIDRTDTLIYQETGWLDRERAALISSARLDRSYTISGTGFIVRTRKEIADPALLALLTADGTR